MSFWNRTALRPALLASLLLTACANTPSEAESGLVTSDIASMMRIAGSARQAGDPAAAIPIYKRAHELNPEDPRPLVELGSVLNELGQFREASEVWSDALGLDPDNAAALQGFGNTLTGLNQPHLALVRYRQALAIEENPATYNGAGVANDMLGRPEEAQSSYRKGLALAPDELRLMNNLGLSLALSGQHDEAISVLERAVTLPGATARHRQNLALAYGLAGDTDKAARISRIDLDETAVQRNLGYYAVLASIGDHSQKVAAVNNLAAQLPPEPAFAQRTEPRQVSSAPDARSTERLETAEANPVEAAPTPLDVERPTVRPAAGASLVPAAQSTPGSDTEESGWYVQVASMSSSDSAANEWTRLQRGQRELLGSLGMRVSRVELSKGIFYRVLAGPLRSKAAAQSLCTQLKERNQDCLLRRI
jgi:Flp pilus assembly protein TadD